MLQVAESKYAEMIKNGSSNDNDNEVINNGNASTTKETLKDSLTTFNIKNKKTYKKFCGII